MRRICADCKEQYDDVDATTICPHEPLRSPEMKAQWESGKRLLGNRVRFHHWPAGSGVNCTTLHFEGMVEIEGQVGLFAPHLFVIDEVSALPVMGTVH
jgi:hypothetical protein